MLWAMKPPRHPDHFLRGSLKELQKDPLGFLTFLHRTYEDISIHRLGPLDHYLVGHPDGIKRILQDNHPNYSKRVADMQTLEYLTGPGVLIGNQFAIAEALIILAHLLRAFRISMPETKPPSAMPLITLRMEHDIEIVLEPRRD
jgi:cytochrome P450